MRLLLRPVCWIVGHDHNTVVDYEARRTYERCRRCGHTFQYDFEENLSSDWIGYCDTDHPCPVCLGWKPKEWKMCSSTYCKVNPPEIRRIQE
jgi:hypothetical protein